MTRNSAIRVCRSYPRPLILMVMALALSGCATNTTRSGIANSAHFDADFESQADRPPTAKTLYTFARLLAAQGKDAECQFVLRRVIEEHPRYLPAYCELAELHLRHRGVEDAIATLSAGLGVSPQDPILLNNLGMCWMLKGDYDKALSMFTPAAAIAPQDARYRANMAASLGMMGRYDEALSLYQQVVPTTEAYYNLSVLCEARNDLDRDCKELLVAASTPEPDSDSSASLTEELP